MPARLRHVARLLDTLREVDRKVTNKILRKALRAGAKVIAKAVKAGCPKDTGALRKSIRVRSPKRNKKNHLGSLVLVGAKMTRAGKPVYYVAPFEYGTAHQAPRPFVRPGFTASVRPANSALVAELRAGIRGLTRR